MIKRFQVKNLKSYPHDENLYLIKRYLTNKIDKTTLELDLNKNQLV